MRCDDSELAAYAAPRHNALSLAEILQFTSPTGVRRRVRRGVLHPYASGTYVFGSGYLSFPGRIRAAAIAAGEGSGGHMEAALAHLGVLPYEPRVIDVLTPNRRMTPAAVRHHRSRSIQPQDIVVVDHVPQASVARAIVGLAAIKSPERIVKVMRDARYHHLLDLDAVRTTSERLRNAPGRATMIAALDAFDLGSGGSFSSVETQGYRLLRDIVSDERPVQNPRLILDGDVVTPDLLWRDSMFCVEFDGPPHLYVDVLRDDAKRDRSYRRNGYANIRIPWFDLAQRPAAVVEDARTTLLAHRATLLWRSQAERRRESATAP